MISDVPKPKLAAEMISGDNLTESTKSLSALKPTIDEIHDRSEQEKDSLNNLYEKGKLATCHHS